MLRKDPYALELSRVLQKILDFNRFHALSCWLHPVLCPQIEPRPVVMCLLPISRTYMVVVDSLPYRVEVDSSYLLCQWLVAGVLCQPYPSSLGLAPLSHGMVQGTKINLEVQ